MSACTHYWTVTSPCPKCLEEKLLQSRAHLIQAAAKLERTRAVLLRLLALDALEGLPSNEPDLWLAVNAVLDKEHP